MIRAARSTPNRDAARTLVAGAAVALLILLGADPLQRLHDRYLLPRPWVHPVVELVPRPGGKPAVTYAARPVAEAEGTWTTWLEIGGQRCCTTKGHGHYTPGRDPRPWDWADWFGTDWPVPQRPFAACVSYALTLTRSGVRAQAGPFCSQPFDPREVP